MKKLRSWNGLENYRDELRELALKESEAYDKARETRQKLRDAPHITLTTMICDPETFSSVHPEGAKCIEAIRRRIAFRKKLEETYNLCPFFLEREASLILDPSPGNIKRLDDRIAKLEKEEALIN
jgi:hypothetical protein